MQNAPHSREVFKAKEEDNHHTKEILRIKAFNYQSASHPPSYIQSMKIPHNTLFHVWLRFLVVAIY